MTHALRVKNKPIQSNQRSHQSCEDKEYSEKHIENDILHENKIIVIVIDEKKKFHVYYGNVHGNVNPGLLYLNCYISTMVYITITRSGARLSFARPLLACACMDFICVSTA